MKHILNYNEFKSINEIKSYKDKKIYKYSDKKNVVSDEYNKALKSKLYKEVMLYFNDISSPAQFKRGTLELIYKPEYDIEDDTSYIVPHGTTELLPVKAPTRLYNVIKITKDFSHESERDPELLDYNKENSIKIPKLYLYDRLAIRKIGTTKSYYSGKEIQMSGFKLKDSYNNYNEAFKFILNDIKNQLKKFHLITKELLNDKSKIDVEIRLNIFLTKIPSAIKNQYSKGFKKYLNNISVKDYRKIQDILPDKFKKEIDSVTSDLADLGAFY
jgi:hypothetical protein